MPASSLRLALHTTRSARTPGAGPAVPIRPLRRPLLALGAALSLATALLVAWPQPTPTAVPMEPLLATPVSGPERDWMLDFLRQADTLYRLGRDGRIWVPQAQAGQLRRQAQALGLAPAGTEAQRGSPPGRAGVRPQWGELKPE